MTRFVSVAVTARNQADRDGGIKRLIHARMSNLTVRNRHRRLAPFGLVAHTSDSDAAYV
jgi:hypothetical protein